MRIRLQGYSLRTDLANRVLFSRLFRALCFLCGGWLADQGA